MQRLQPQGYFHLVGLGNNQHEKSTKRHFSTLLEEWWLTMPFSHSLCMHIYSHTQKYTPLNPQ